MNGMWYGTGFLKQFVFIKTTNGYMGMVKVWFGYALMEPGNIFQPYCNKATPFCYGLGF